MGTKEESKVRVTEREALLIERGTVVTKSGTAKKVLRTVNPLGMRVVVKIIKESNQTEAGLYLPEGAKGAMHESVLGEVLDVASAIDDETSEETNISGIPCGALILIPKNAGIRIPWDENLRIVETKEVLAIVEEVEIL